MLKRGAGKVVGPAVSNILQSSTKFPLSRGMGSITMKRNRGGISHDNTELRQYRSQPGGCWQIPYIGSERKNSVRKAGERYKPCEEKSGSVEEILPLYHIWRIPPPPHNHV